MHKESVAVDLIWGVDICPVELKGNMNAVVPPDEADVLGGANAVPDPEVVDVPLVEIAYPESEESEMSDDESKM